MAIDNYLDLVTSQHRNQPNFIAWLSAALSKIDDIVTLLNGMNDQFSIDDAVGAQLDVVGQLVGQSRNVDFNPDGASSKLDDDHYRLLLKAKIAQNQWNGTIPQIYDIWDALFTDSQLQIIDNQNMTMQAIITGTLDVISTQLVSNGYIIPKPMGVALTIIEQTTISDTAYQGAVVTGSDTYTLTAPAG